MFNWPFFLVQSRDLSLLQWLATR